MRNLTGGDKTALIGNVSRDGGFLSWSNHWSTESSCKSVPLCSTIPPLHWDALDARRLHVRFLSEQHDTLHHPSGEFFWKFLLYMCFLFYFFKVIWSWIWKLWPQGVWIELSVPLQLGFCLFNPFDCTLIVKWSNISQALPVFSVPYGPFYDCSTTNRPMWHHSESVLSSSLSQTTSYPRKSRRSKPFFFLPKKYMSTFPFPFSLLSSRLLFLDCLTICCSECL